MNDNLHETMELGSKTFKLDFDKVKRKALFPIKFPEIRANGAHACLSLADVVQSPIRITAVLTK